MVVDAGEHRPEIAPVVGDCTQSFYVNPRFYRQTAAAVAPGADPAHAAPPGQPPNLKIDYPFKVGGCFVQVFGEGGAG